VILAGSFNKVLFPSLRLGYLVLPQSLMDRFLAFRYQADAYPPTHLEAVLCDFIVEGHFGRHLRRMRELYGARLGALRDSVGRYLKGIVELPDIQAGLNSPAYLVNGMKSNDAAALRPFGRAASREHSRQPGSPRPSRNVSSQEGCEFLRRR
jgi:GntR family transcriptional regulator / MocR family aminotransferase